MAKRYHFLGNWREDGASQAVQQIEGIQYGLSLEDAVRVFERKIGRTFSSFAEILPGGTPHRCCNGGAA